MKFDRKCKNAKHRCHQQIYYKPRNKGGGGGYSVLVNYQSFLSNLFSSAPQLFFSSIRNRLLRVSFVELFDFIIYQHLNILLQTEGLCSGKLQAIKAVPCGRWTPARVRSVTSPFHCLHELDRQIQPS